MKDKIPQMYRHICQVSMMYVSGSGQKSRKIKHQCSSADINVGIG